VTVSPHRRRAGGALLAALVALAAVAPAAARAQSPTAEERAAGDALGRLSAALTGWSLQRAAWIEDPRALVAAAAARGVEGNMGHLARDGDLAALGLHRVLLGASVVPAFTDRAKTRAAFVNPLLDTVLIVDRPAVPAGAAPTGLWLLPGSAVRRSRDDGGPSWMAAAGVTPGAAMAASFRDTAAVFAAGNPAVAGRDPRRVAGATPAMADEAVGRALAFARPLAMAEEGAGPISTFFAATSGLGLDGPSHGGRIGRQATAAVASVPEDLRRFMVPAGMIRDGSDGPALVFYVAAVAPRIWAVVRARGGAAFLDAVEAVEVVDAAGG
jgi:hypothetical protein